MSSHQSRKRTIEGDPIIPIIPDWQQEAYNMAILDLQTKSSSYESFNDFIMTLPNAELNESQKVYIKNTLEDMIDFLYENNVAEHTADLQRIPPLQIITRKTWMQSITPEQTRRYKVLAYPIINRCLHTFGYMFNIPDRDTRDRLLNVDFSLRRNSPIRFLVRILRDIIENEIIDVSEQTSTEVQNIRKINAQYRSMVYEIWNILANHSKNSLDIVRELLRARIKSFVQLYNPLPDLHSTIATLFQHPDTLLTFKDLSTLFIKVLTQCFRVESWESELEKKKKVEMVQVKMNIQRMFLKYGNFIEFGDLAGDIATLWQLNEHWRRY